MTLKVFQYGLDLQINLFRYLIQKEQTHFQSVDPLRQSLEYFNWLPSGFKVSLIFKVMR